MTSLRLSVNKPDGMTSHQLHIASVQVGGKWIEARGKDRVAAVNALIDRLVELLQEREQ